MYNELWSSVNCRRRLAAQLSSASGAHQCAWGAHAPSLPNDALGGNAPPVKTLTGACSSPLCLRSMNAPTNAPGPNHAVLPQVLPFGPGPPTRGTCVHRKQCAHPPSLLLLCAGVHAAFWTHAHHLSSDYGTKRLHSSRAGPPCAEPQPPPPFRGGMACRPGIGCISPQRPAYLQTLPLQPRARTRTT